MGCVSCRLKQTVRANNGEARADDGQRQPPPSLQGLWAAQEAVSVLLIFPPEDALLRRFAKAAECLGLACDIASTSSSAAGGSGGGGGGGGPSDGGEASAAAVTRFSRTQHHLVVLDRREAAAAVDTLLRALKATAAASTFTATTFAAVTKAGAAGRGTQLNDLLQLGFDVKIKEELCSSVEACAEELLSLQRNTFRLQQRIGSLGVVLTAVGNCSDAVEITDDKFAVQYVNAAHERMFGYTLSELSGRNTLEAIHRRSSADRVGDDDAWSLTLCLKRGRAWDGILSGRRKSGTSLDHYGAVYPVRDWKGSVHRYVWLRRSLNGVSAGGDHQQIVPSSAAAAAAASAATTGRNSSSALTTPSRQAYSRRGSAVARVGSSAAIDAPINKVINLISMVQDGSSPAVAAALDKVLEILHQSADLYSGELASNSQDDRMTSDYVGGLMASGNKLVEKKRHSVAAAQRQNSASNMQTLRDTPEHLLSYLEGDDDWNFDILALERVTDRKPMVHLGMRTLRRFNVCRYLQCTEDTMLRWLQVMQDHYRADNCYHNATHGADVMQCSAYFLSRDRVKLAFDETDEAASLLGALVHDLDHPGRTNPFLVNSRHLLALLYNDFSVLESHHVSLAFQLTTKDERINIFKNMSADDYKRLRQSIIDVVLATEMAKHFEHVGKFANQILAPLLAMEEDAGAEDGVGGQPISEEEVQELLTKPENRTLIRRVLIKCSDVSNPCRPLNLCKEWAGRISEEYFQQTDEEKAKGMPIVMPAFDRASCNMPKSQVSFIDFFLKEMFTVWHKFCDVPILLENLNANYAYWKGLIEDES